MAQNAVIPTIIRKYINKSYLDFYLLLDHSLTNPNYLEELLSNNPGHPYGYLYMMSIGNIRGGESYLKVGGSDWFMDELHH